jgi:hypothetical protein
LVPPLSIIIMSGGSATEDRLPTYQITALDHGRIIDVATANSAKRAVARFLDALEQYNGAWVRDETGNELTFDVLCLRAVDEDGNL